jgi:hypothetical protein
MTTPRFVSRPVNSTLKGLPHIVFDEVLQMDVFHWHGPTGKAKCDAVAAALNALNHGKD